MQVAKSSTTSSDLLVTSIPEVEHNQSSPVNTAFKKMDSKNMAHISSPVLRHNVTAGEGTSSQGSTDSRAKLRIPKVLQNSFEEIPDLIRPHLLDIILHRPENGEIFSFRTKKGTFTLWANFVRPKKEDCKDWGKSKFPVQNQGEHQYCWSIGESEHISEAREIHGIDAELTSYSGQFLVDFADPVRAKERFLKTKQKHYCYPYPGIYGMEYAMAYGMPKTDDWGHTGCHTGVLPSFKDDVKLHHVLNDARAFSDVRKAIHYLQTQPILGQIGVFKPEFANIGDQVYRGPTSVNSFFSAWHQVSVRFITVEDGELIAHCRNSHGEEKGGLLGYFKASLDVMLLELCTIGKSSFTTPSRLFRAFFCGEVRDKFEREVEDHYIEGHQLGSSDYMSFLILEGIFHNTSGSVIQREDGKNEIIGTPTNRALLKWALERDMSFSSIKSESMFIKRSGMDSTMACLGTAIKCENISRQGVRIHWKGDAKKILEKCTRAYDNGVVVPMCETKREAFKAVIENMVAKGLICVALASKSIGNEDVPSTKEIKNWILPNKRLVLLGIFGIKNPCPQVDDDERQALPTFAEENKIEARGTGEESKELPDDSIPHDGLECSSYVTDSSAFLAGEKIKPEHWRYYYDSDLCARLGLYCYNLQKGTAYDFGFVRKLYTRYDSFSKSFITLEAVNPADRSRFTLETCVKHNYEQVTSGLSLWWETHICRGEGSEEADYEWDDEAVDAYYKGDMPKWLSDEDQQLCYVVAQSELRDKKNWWLHLLTEFAFFTKWNGTLRARDIADCRPLITQHVIVETHGEGEKEPSDKLNAANAIFYISFDCATQGRYRAVVRKTMDGKPGHMRLEVMCWSMSERAEERGPEPTNITK